MVRGLDHLVVGVHDLEAAASLWEKLGFQVGRRNRHPWGTHNRIVQFPGSFIELITVAEPDLIAPHREGYFSFGAFVRDALARSEGLSMLVLDSSDAVADAASFAERGLGAFAPFFFERAATAADGSSRRVAFTLAFAATGHAPQCGFFVCQQHEPQNFWNAAFQQHANGATGLAEVDILAPDLALAPFLEGFSGATPVRMEADLCLPLARASLVVRSRLPGASTSARFGTVTFTCGDLDSLLGRALSCGLAASMTADGLEISGAGLRGLVLRAKDTVAGG